MFADSFLLEKTKRFDIKGKRYIDGPIKYFYTDVGIRNAILNFRKFEENHLMENVIFNELIAQGYSVDVGSIENNNKNEQKVSKRKQLEVDFVVNKTNGKIYIQSALHLDSEEKKMQELMSLLKIQESFKKIVVVKDNIKSHYEENGIFYIGLFDFLMSDEV